MEVPSTCKNSWHVIHLIRVTYNHLIIAVLYTPVRWFGHTAWSKHTTEHTLLRHTQNTQPHSPALAHAMYLIASQFTVRNDVTDSHLLSVTFVWHISVCIPLTSCKSMKGDSLPTHIITQSTYFFWQLSFVNSRLHYMARAGGMMRVSTMLVR